MQMQRDTHLKAIDLLRMLQVKDGDFAKYAIVSGTVERSLATVKQLKDHIKNFSFFEYSMYTGSYDGIKVTAGNGGRYSTDSAIAAELLCAGGIKFIIRTGSCGAMDENINIGDIVISDEIICGDGVTPYYVDGNFKTVSDKDVVLALKKSSEMLGVKCHQGKVWTTDALLRETRELVEDKRKNGAIAVDMVSSSLLTIAQINQVKAASILAVSDNLITGQMGFTDVRYYDAEHKIIQIALGAIKILEGK